MKVEAQVEALMPSWLGLEGRSAVVAGAGAGVTADLRSAAGCRAAIDQAAETLGRPGRSTWVSQLCSNDVLILEVADLLDVEPGVYDMVSLPIPLQGAEAAPSRTLLWPR
jgi:hypothetical protein